MRQAVLDSISTFNLRNELDHRLALERAEKILHTLSSRRFQEWNETDGPFGKYIMADVDTPTKSEILANIIRLFHLGEF
jgi:hypothetical protein